METHQDLLDAYVRAELGLISEFSADINASKKELLVEVTAYAAIHGLEVPEIEIYE